MIRVFNEFEQNFKFPRNIKKYLDKINKTANLYFSNCLIYLVTLLKIDVDSLAKLGCEK